MGSALRTSMAVAAGLVLGACYDRLSIDPHGFACATSEQCGGALACVRGRCGDAHRAELTDPVRAAFFRLDYPFSWKSPGGASPHQTPSLGHYTALDALPQHLRMFEWAHLDVALTYWWGNGSPTDSALSRFMPAAEHSDVRWAVVYMRETADHPSGTELIRFLADVRVKFSAVPNYYRVGGKPFLYVMSDPRAPTCELADRWVTANANKEAGVYLALRPSSAMDGGFSACPSQPGAWLDFDEGQPELARGDSFSVSPGAFDWNAATPELERDPTRFELNAAHLAASSAKLQLVSSFNDWSSGTAVESAVEWSTDGGFGRYLDILHQHGNSQ
ncbi:MAG: hypothetical protein IPJ65_04705 [Archangiaceae bacterium]|nr:hypothetical protein [Archangiaceae bacterium]